MTHPAIRHYPHPMPSKLDRDRYGQCGLTDGIFTIRGAKSSYGIDEFDMEPLAVSTPRDG
ncbi:MAG: hypothetical protein ACYC0V_05745 [Armatimonadota bacterium]